MNELFVRRRKWSSHSTHVHGTEVNSSRHPACEGQRTTYRRRVERIKIGQHNWGRRNKPSFDESRRRGAQVALGLWQRILRKGNLQGSRVNGLERTGFRHINWQRQGRSCDIEHTFLLFLAVSTFSSRRLGASFASFAVLYL